MNIRQKLNRLISSNLGGGTRYIELEVKRIKAINSGVTRGAYTPYFDFTEIDHVGEATAYYKLKVTCNSGYYVRIDRNANPSTVDTYAADGSVSTPNTENTTATTKAPFNDLKYAYIGVGINPYRTITEDEIDTILENADVQIKVYNDQDQEVAQYKMVNKTIN